MGGVPDGFATTLELTQAVAGKTVFLMHPWSLSEPPAGAAVVAWLCPEFHAAHPWSARRWDWVVARMDEVTPLRFVGGAQALRAALAGATGVSMLATPHKGYAAVIFAKLPAPRLLPPLDKYCGSFSKFYHTARKQVKDLESCL
jgi:deoxyribodipyrimidine photo-lyase